uniref:Lcl C-terminal domain-containing protein n=2 Tax=Marinilabilia salmonicolor TaxID=989 RepID=UPI00029B0B63
AGTPGLGKFLTFTLRGRPRAYAQTLTFPIVGTNQTKFYNNRVEIEAPGPNDPFYGQDATYADSGTSYTDNGDGTITDNITGLMWVKARGSKMTWDEAVAGASKNNTAGYDDWRMPSIQELYSLFLFSGQNGSSVYSTEGYTPYIDTAFFEFEYGSGIGRERVMECQDWSGTEYVSTTQHNQPTVFGVNFADGRSKGYKKYLPPTWTELNDALYVRYVRGNAEYGKNNFMNNNDGTISDLATGLMWSEEDSKKGMNWKEALAWVQEKNSENFLGHNNWRLPNIKELHSIVDYTCSPEKTSSAAIHTDYFKCSTIINEANQEDYPYYWTGTVLVAGGPTREACYIPFGRAMAKMDGVWQDVHGAGSQKSDVMIGDPADYPKGHGPQGDAVRIYNYVRLVRDI